MLANERNLGLFPIFLLTYRDERKYFHQTDSRCQAILLSLEDIMEREF